MGKGKICAVTAISDQTLPVNHKQQSYKCETETYLDDPYEGELLTYFLQFFTNLSKKDKQTLWEYKRPKLEKAEYNKSGVGPITVRKGMYYLKPPCLFILIKLPKVSGFPVMRFGTSSSCHIMMSKSFGKLSKNSRMFA